MLTSYMRDGGKWKNKISSALPGLTDKFAKVARLCRFACVMSLVPVGDDPVKPNPVEFWRAAKLCRPKATTNKSYKLLP